MYIVTENEGSVEVCVSVFGKFSESVSVEIIEDVNAPPSTGRCNVNSRYEGR